jgi:hypothetical protein
LRDLPANNLDFRKLFQLCEELNVASKEGCYLASAMLIRAILDHVPPLSGSGSGRSFREAMQSFGAAARKIADSHLHSHIRKRETLPAAQQTPFGPQLDVLLAEIARTIG